jgi:pyridoxamine 5'-phosphate oxidase
LRFLGIDFGWEGKPSGLAALEWNGGSLHLLRLDLLTAVEEILEWVDRQAGADTVIGIDAPIVIPNETGMRDADKLAHSFFGKYHAGAYPASRARRYWRRTTGLSDELARRGFAHGDLMKPRSGGRYQIEVHPHAATVQLYGLDRIIKYKRGTVAARRAELSRLRTLILEELPKLTPRLAVADLPEVPENGAEMKALEDRMDAITSAYVAAHWWYWGRERNDVLGDSERGYIIAPKRRVARVSVAELRENYARAGLLETDLNPDPMAQFENWFADARAAGLKEPNAMTLATVSADGTPSARIVLLKGVDERGFMFYTNYESRKGREIAVNERVALVFYWAELERQVRVTGVAQRVSHEESAAYFASRPRGSQLGAWASEQSAPITGRKALERSLAEVEQRFREQPAPLPPFWGGYRVTPDSIEFWQGRPNRLHDRLRYVRGRDAWRVERLSP